MNPCRTSASWAAGAPAIPMPPRGDTIARYATYLEAQRAVDYLSDQAFPVQAVTIVAPACGWSSASPAADLPISPARVLSGAYFGAWLGLFLTSLR